MRFHRYALALLVAAAICVAQGGASAAPETVVAQASLAVPYRPQATLRWAWVASAQMVAQYYKKDTPSQCAMLQKAYDAPCCTDSGACDVPGTVAQVQSIIKDLGLSYSMVDRPPSQAELLSLINSGQPLLIHFRMGHFAVISGMRVVDTPTGRLGIVHLLDPHFGEGDVELPSLYPQWDVAMSVSRKPA
ncbi:MAG: hypothetical protein JO127_04460 [Caulobacteraceae bacterium]|nr:hypothetical protein [Caulobacteraceae bacterium]